MIISFTYTASNIPHIQTYIDTRTHTHTHVGRWIEAAFVYVVFRAAFFFLSLSLSFFVYIFLSSSS